MENLTITVPLWLVVVGIVAAIVLVALALLWLVFASGGHVQEYKTGSDGIPRSESGAPAILGLVLFLGLLVLALWSSLHGLTVVVQ